MVGMVATEPIPSYDPDDFIIALGPSACLNSRQCIVQRPTSTSPAMRHSASHGQYTLRVVGCAAHLGCAACPGACGSGPGRLVLGAGQAAGPPGRQQPRVHMASMKVSFTSAGSDEGLMRYTTKPAPSCPDRPPPQYLQHPDLLRLDPGRSGGTLLQAPMRSWHDRFRVQGPGSTQQVAGWVSAGMDLMG